jgi:C4-dicarboxylate-specific signal transduction histidine kinase
MQVVIRDITKRKEAEDKLKRLNDDLEDMVKERTEKLLKSNKLLKEEIVERKELEKQKEKIQAEFLQVQKMEAIGTLAGGIAHDFNNILTSIKNLTSLALKRIGKDDPLKEYIEPMLDISRMGADLVQQLLIYSRNKPFSSVRINLNDVIDGLMSMATSLVGDKIEVERKFSRNLWGIESDRGRVEQVITNMIVNGANAMPHGGKITLCTSNVTLKEGEPGACEGVRTGRFVCLLIEDTGVGMEDETIERIFEPFFTTNFPNGTGLGLSVVYGIVKELNGWVDVSSVPGEGTVFRVYFPAIS